MTDYTPFTGRRQRDPTLLLVETCWHLRSPTGRILTCGIYDTDAPGREVRVGYGDELLYSRRLPDMESARAEAAELREAVFAKGFSEAPETTKADP